MSRNRIFKYPIRITDEQVIEFPGRAHILTVQDQPHSSEAYLFLWAVVDPEAGYVSQRRIRIIGTGNPMPVDDPGFYITTVQKNGLVWHIFDASTAV